MPRPNVLIVQTDQQRTDSLSCYGSSFISTPGFDHVAANGTRYNRAYCPSAVCTPSRASLLTGQYPMRHGVWNVGVNAGTEQRFLSHRLGEAGYRTCLVGKAHFEAYLAGPEQSRESVAGYRTGYGDWTGPYYGFEEAHLALGHSLYGLSGEYGHWVRERLGADAFERLQPATIADGGREFGGNAYDWELPTELHNSVWTADRAIDFLATERGDAPFFLYVNFQDPHHPHAVPTDYAGRLDPATMQLPKFVEGELDDMPPHFRLAREGRLDGSRFTQRWMMAGQGSGFDYRGIPETAQQLGRAYYYSLVKLIDDQLVRLWATLEQQGLSENTLVFVTSDHGELLGDHGLWMKGPFHYEPLARIPLLAMGPGIARSEISDAVVSLVDIAPTILAQAGVVVDPADFDGRPLSPESDINRTVLCETILDWDGMICRSIIDSRYKLTCYAGETFGELFDLEADPGELSNLWDVNSYFPVRLGLLGKLVDQDVRMQRSAHQRIAYA